jgi:tetracycline 7-halogenase / FADH2 O2-dependent halogenase
MTGTKVGGNTGGDPIRCDVLILGSGLAGSITASILARNGANVALVDAASHPRFAIGESTTPLMVLWLNVLAERYDVPEIKNLTSVESCIKTIGPVFGLKGHFGFVRHEEGREPDPQEALQFVLPGLFGHHPHLYRQDTDSYFFQVAAKYGCTVRQSWRATDIDLDADGVTVTGHNGEIFRAKYLIDASGARSPLAETLDLRDKPPRFKHHARSMFTHYVGVKPFDDVSGIPAPPKAWHEGTTHHVFDRGWFWIIPFDSVEGSKNPVCSVGLTIDERKYPKPSDMTPEQDFQRFLDMYPAVKRQFDGAHRIREWTSTDRLQYSSKRTVGDRWCLMSHAAGFLDPLYSRGLSNTFEVVHALCRRVLAALQDGDFSAERFNYVEELEQGLLKYNDALVNASYISFSHFRLWNGMFRVWGAFTAPGDIRVMRARLRFVKDGDVRHFDELEDQNYPGLWFPCDSFDSVVMGAASICERYEAGESTGDQAADALMTMLQQSNIVNEPYGWKDPEQRLIAADKLTIAKFMKWAVLNSGPDIKDLFRGFLRAIAAAGPKGVKSLR